MIKKIDANKYGVVRYAISSIEDIADLPREVSVGSEAILVNEDGEKKFRLGSDGWVEVVEVKEYDEDKLRDILEDAKVGYGGIEYETLEERLDKDFDNAYSVLDNRTYIGYEGCRITAKDSLNGLQKETVIKGRTLQNLCVDYANKEKNTFTLKDKITVLGSDVDYRSETFRIRTLKFAYDLKANTTYTFIVNIHSLETVNNTLSNYIVDGDGTTRYSFIFLKGVGVHKEKFTTTGSGAKTIAIFINVEETSATFSCPMILEGDHTETPLEKLPFIEGIESVGDKSKNLFNGKLEIGMISTEGVYTSYSRTLRTQMIEIKPNTQYRSSFDIKYVQSNTDSGASHNRFIFFDENRNYISHIVNKDDFITSTNAKYLAWTMYSQFKTTDIAQEAITKTKFQVEEGTTQTPYQPYYEGYKISGKSIGKNFYRGINNVSYNGFSEGTWVFVNGDQLAYGNNLVKHSTKFNLPLGEYVFNCNGGNFMQIIKNKEEEIIPKGKKFTVTSINDTYCIRARVKADNELVEFKEIQIEQATAPTQYEPYKESAYSYILDEPLRSLPNGVCDEIDLEKGVVTRRVGKVVLDGSEDWSIDTSVANTRFYFYQGLSDAKSSNDRECIISDNFFDMSKDGHTLNGGFHYQTSIFLYKDLASVSDFKQWLQANPTTVYYELANPTTEYLIKDDKFVTLPNGVKDEAGRIVTRNVGKVVLNGSRNWTGSAIKNENHIKYFTYINDENGKNLKVDNAPIISPTFPVIGCGQNSGDLDKYKQDIEGLYADTTISISVAKNRLETEDSNGLKKWLSQNPITVYYELTKPYIECSYEKYPTLPNGVKDEVSYNSVLRRVGKFVVDGSQVLTRSSTNSNKTKTTHFSVNGISSNSPYGICDKLPTVIDASLQAYEEPCMKFSSADKINPPYALWLNIDRSNADTVEEAYEYFRNNPHTVWYELITPYIEPINLDEVILDTTRLKSYEPITHITSDNYLPPTIKTQVPSDFNAVVLGLKSNNEALASQVMSLRQTNDELEATNREQDDVIDVTLLALDEVYGMIDESEIETMSMGSPMVNVYVKMVKRGIKTLDEVPSKYRAEVEELI